MPGAAIIPFPPPGGQLPGFDLMDILDLVRAAVSDLGEGASAEAVSRHVAERHGVRVDARFVPVYRAALRAEELRKEACEWAARIIEEDRRARETNPEAARP